MLIIKITILNTKNLRIRLVGQRLLPEPHMRWSLSNTCLILKNKFSTTNESDSIYPHTFPKLRVWLAFWIHSEFEYSSSTWPRIPGSGSSSSCTWKGMTVGLSQSEVIPFESDWLTYSFILSHPVGHAINSFGRHE